MEPGVQVAGVRECGPEGVATSCSALGLVSWLWGAYCAPHLLDLHLFSPDACGAKVGQGAVGGGGSSAAEGGEPLGDLESAFPRPHRSVDTSSPWEPSSVDLWLSFG